MDTPTPEQERELYIQALTAAAPVVASMEPSEQRSLIRHWDTEATPEKILQYRKDGSVQFHALTTMADMLWEHVMRFQSTQDSSMENMMNTPQP